MTPIMYTITKSKYSMLTTTIEQNLKKNLNPKPGPLQWT